MLKYTSNILPDLNYFVKGDNPELLIHSGTHGDEFEVIDCVTSAIKKYEKFLPDFVFVPEVSPSAVKERTRINNNGHDLNRIFFSDSDDLEVKENIKILKKYHFDLAVSFHEDPEFDCYYVYDETHDEAISKKVLGHVEFLKSKQVKLLTGLDDPDDPYLGHEFKEGYAKFTHPIEKDADGTLTLWAYSQKLVKNILVPEVAGKVSINTKQMIVDSFFERILI